jgi:hypothetical protein
MTTPTYDYISSLSNKVAWWPLDDADPTNEEVGGLDLTLLNTPTTGVDMGFAAGDTGIFFAEASSEGASVAHNAAFDPGTNDWSVAFWAIIPTSDGTTRYVISHDGNGSAGTWEVRHTSSLLSGRFASLSANSAFTPNSSVKFIVYNNDRDGVQTKYIDGSALSGTVDISGSPGSLAFNGTFYLGRRQTTGHGDVTLAHVVLRTALWTAPEMTAAMAARLDSGAAAPTSSIRALSSLRNLRNLTT